MAVGTLGTLTGSVSGQLEGVLEITSTGDREVETVEEQPTLASANGRIDSDPVSYRDGPLTFTMKFDNTHKAERDTLLDLAAAAAVSGTTETWTVAPPTGSSEVCVGFVSRVGGLHLGRNNHMQYEVAIQPSTGKTFTA